MGNDVELVFADLPSSMHAKVQRAHSHLQCRHPVYRWTIMTFEHGVRAVVITPDFADVVGTHWILTRTTTSTTYAGSNHADEGDAVEIVRLDKPVAIVVAKRPGDWRSSACPGSSPCTTAVGPCVLRWPLSPVRNVSA